MTYYWRWRPDRLLFAFLNGPTTHALDLDSQLLIGGDTGLRGYPLRYESGTSRGLLTVEQRFYTDWYPFRLARAGAKVTRFCLTRVVKYVRQAQGESRAYCPRSSTSQESAMTTMSDTDLTVISSEKVEGTAVYNPDGTKLGSIDDLMIDKWSGQVRYAVLEFGGFLGMGTDRYPLPWKVLKYSNEYGGYVVPLPKSILEKAPKYSESEIPTYDRDYGTRVDSYYQQY